MNDSSICQLVLSHTYKNISITVVVPENKVRCFRNWSFWFKQSVTVCPFYEMLLRSKKVSRGDFGKGPEDDNFILNDE